MVDGTLKISGIIYGTPEYKKCKSCMIQKKTKQIINLQNVLNERVEPVLLNKLNQNDWAPIGAVHS